MPKITHVAVGGEVYHCINRSNGRVTIFNTDDEYRLKLESTIRKPERPKKG